MNKAVWSSILVAAMVLAVCVSAEAQQPKKVFRIGYLSALAPATESYRSDATVIVIEDQYAISGTQY